MDEEAFFSAPLGGSGEFLSLPEEVVCFRPDEARTRTFEVGSGIQLSFDVE